MKKTLKLSTWQTYNFKLVTKFVNNEKITAALITFKKDIFIDIPIKYKLFILFKIKYIDNTIRTISYLQIINIDEFNKLNKIFIDFWNLRTEDYHEAEISEILFTYKLVDNQENKIETKIIETKETNIQTGIKSSLFLGFNLPNTMDITEWGNYQFIDETNIIIYKKSSTLHYEVELFENSQIVKLKSDDKIYLEFKDIMNHKSDLSTFTRLLKNQEYFFEDGELSLKKITKNLPYLSSIKKSLYNSKKFLTMDLETRVINNEMSSYCVSIYDGKTLKSFYLSDYKNEKDMLRSSILYLMKRKYNNYKVYLHNFSNFDSIYLLTVMCDISENITPIIRDGRFINLIFGYGKKYRLHFRDSLLLLPSSLRNLAISFNVDQKTIFPYKFVNNPNIPLNYIGVVPEFSYFDKIDLEDYNNYASKFNNNWDLKKETIKYCEQDCIVLYKLIDKFSDRIYKLFRIDILKYPTLSSLAFAIYRSSYLKNHKIPLITGIFYDFIKKSYTGGSVDVYKPRPNINTKIYRYDVNSLYPFAMKHYPMPVGTPIYFEGDILKFENNPFGIFEVEIQTPAFMAIPLLQTRIKTKNGFRTIAPLGNWTGIYSSEELFNAAKYGYKFKILRGYLFEKDNIFSDYVDELYKIKLNSPRNSADYTIAKLLLNSLYGRLGMRQDSEQHVILNNDNANKFYSKFKILNILDLKNGKELISYIKDNTDDEEFYIKNISVVVSSMITAAARIYMSQFKTNKNYNLYYSDTDSIDIDQELDPKFIGEGLGQMKLEHIFDDAIFLSPKVYGGYKNINNKDHELVKIKGLKNPIKFNELKPLLKKDFKLEVKNEKWYKDLTNGKFNIKDETYNLMVTSSKRKLLYDKDNNFSDTLPLILKNGILIE